VVVLPRTRRIGLDGPVELQAEQARTRGAEPTVRA